MRRGTRAHGSRAARDRASIAAAAPRPAMRTTATARVLDGPRPRWLQTAPRYTARELERPDQGPLTTGGYRETLCDRSDAAARRGRLRPARPGAGRAGRRPGSAAGAAGGGRGRGLSPEQQAAARRADRAREEHAADSVRRRLAAADARRATRSARPKASRSIPRSTCSSTRAAATPARRAARRPPSSSSSTRPDKYVKEWGQNAYGFSFAHAIRFDKDDNLWVVDEGSNMVMKFNPQGLVTMVLGRKDEAIDYLEALPRGRPITPSAARTPSRAPAPAAAAASAGRPTSPSTRRATSSSPTATTTRASRSSPRTATS